MFSRGVYHVQVPKVPSPVPKLLPDVTALPDDVDTLLQERCEEYRHEELHFAGWHIDSDGHFQPDDSDDEGGLNWDW